MESEAAMHVYEALEAYIREHGYSPTVRELAKSMGTASLSTTHFHLCSLRKAGMVDWQPGLARTLRTIQRDK